MIALRRMRRRDNISHHVFFVIHADNVHRVGTNETKILLSSIWSFMDVSGVVGWTGWGSLFIVKLVHWGGRLRRRSRYGNARQTSRENGAAYYANHKRGREEREKENGARVIRRIDRLVFVPERLSALFLARLPLAFFLVFRRERERQSIPGGGVGGER